MVEKQRGRERGGVEGYKLVLFESLFIQMDGISSVLEMS